MAILRYLYGLPLFAAAVDDEPEKMVDPWTWYELGIVADKLKIVGLQTHATHELERYFEKTMSVDAATGLLQDKTRVEWFVQNVKLLRGCMDRSGKTDAYDVILKFCCRHFTQLEPNKKFKELADAMPELYRDMLKYGARQKSDFLR